jgi:hypothetical protein
MNVRKKSRKHVHAALASIPARHNSRDYSLDRRERDALMTEKILPTCSPDTELLLKGMHVRDRAKFLS